MKSYTALRARRVLKNGTGWHPESLTAFHVHMDELVTPMMACDLFAATDYLFFVRFAVDFLKQNGDEEDQIELVARVLGDMDGLSEQAGNAFVCKTGDTRRALRTLIIKICDEAESLSAPQRP